MTTQHFQTTAVILGYDLGVYRNLCKSESLNVEELARESGAEPALLGEFKLPTPTPVDHFILWRVLILRRSPHSALPRFDWHG